LRNLQGKYQGLIFSAIVKSFEEISPLDINQLDTPIIYADTVQKFNIQKRTYRHIYQIKADKGNKSAWGLIQERQDYSSREKRELIVIYDEGHNLTDSQAKKILELNPQAIILASGTPSLPHSLKIMQEELDKKGISSLYQVPFVEVKDKQMVKSKLVLGGYKTQKEEVINEMLDKD
jgi:type III restriction enzyme